MDDHVAPLTGDEWHELAAIERELCRDAALCAVFADLGQRRRGTLHEIAWRVAWGTLLMIGTVLLFGGLLAGALALAAGGFVAVALALDELAHHTQRIRPADERSGAPTRDL